MNLLLFFVLCALSITLASADVKHETTSKHPFYMLSLGDSWASGAEVTERHWYEDDGTCGRGNRSWEYLLAQDRDWTESEMNFTFMACSGAHLSAATHPDNDEAEAQIEPVKTLGGPVLLTMQLGATDCNFSNVARACIFMGGSNGKKYPDPDSACAQAINEADRYINGDTGLLADHQKTLASITNWKPLNGTDNWNLYVVGYAEFFNAKTTYCNDMAFDKDKQAKLTTELRTKINLLIQDANNAIARSVERTTNTTDASIRFFNPSSLFQSHRFCEKGRDLNGQYFSDDVWFWNLSPPEIDLSNGNKTQIQEMWLNNQTLPNGDQVTDLDLDDMIAEDRGRTLRPKYDAHKAIKEAMVKQLRADKVPGVKSDPVTTAAATTTTRSSTTTSSAIAAPSPTGKQPYASGQVRIHVQEWWGCPSYDDENNLSIAADIWDNDVNIGSVKHTSAGATAPLSLASKFEQFMVITPEWADGGYVQFALGSLSFNTLNNTNQAFYPYSILHKGLYGLWIMK
ncbi:SGNH hydrolase-type esterase domain-containing protein [Macrophomina phaseolina]|uniref:SGNH hydrolase-type esterase domain-containing protein n=1 Tax=Macrophomina phaseolina TaxID=35725 RepID=A0ABQ8GSV2_9PEZI|nr:SGNH hydrolase-type esterase domain-containing protein [Macrophomina phaseolina]